MGVGERVSTLELGCSGEERRESMRFMLKFAFPTTAESNALVRNGSIGPTMETILGRLQPEAAYFCHVDGKRGRYLVVDVEEASELVTKMEPFPGTESGDRNLPRHERGRLESGSPRVMRSSSGRCAPRSFG
jgi:hypothetical protein